MNEWMYAYMHDMNACIHAWHACMHACHALICMTYMHAWMNEWMNESRLLQYGSFDIK